MNKWIVYFVCLIFTDLSAQNLQPFKLYSKTGVPISYERMLLDLTDQEVILFGEFHDNSIVHWLQLQLMKDLCKERNLQFGLEMFESDQQQVLNQYINNKINAKAFDTLTRFWGNYPTDYKPLVIFAKEHQMNVTATNIPRKYASKLYKEGEEKLLTLPAEEKRWIAPLPFPYDKELSQYKKIMGMFAGSSHANSNFPKAQAIKDATMAHFILKNRDSTALFYHINGSFHSNYHQGIYWYLQKYHPNIKIKTISVYETGNVDQFNIEEKPLADYIFYIPSDMIKTYN